MVTDGNGGGEPKGPPSDIFDNLAALRLEPDRLEVTAAPGVCFPPSGR
jgi:hypothetical protein